MILEPWKPYESYVEAGPPQGFHQFYIVKTMILEPWRPYESYVEAGPPQGLHQFHIVKTMRSINFDPPFFWRPISGSPDTPKCGQNALVLFDFTLRPFFGRSLPRPPKMLKKAPHLKMAILVPTWPQDGHLGPNLGDLGAILAPTWSHLGPIWRDFARSEPGQN